MKINFHVLSISVNVVLLGVLFFFLKSRPPAKPRSNSEKEQVLAPSIVQTQRDVGMVKAAVPLSKFHWREIESEDYPTYIANLRAIRCPEKTIFDIIFADIEKLYAERGKQLEQTKRWVAGEDFEKARLEKIRKQVQLEEEKQALIKTLLNSDLDWEVMQGWYSEKDLGMFAGFLPDSKAEQALSITKKFMERGERVDRRAGGLLIEEDAQEKTRLYRGMRTALLGIIFAEELEEGELRAVALASYIFSSGDLGKSKLSGLELRRIMQFQTQFNNPFERELGKYNGIDSAPEEASKQKFMEETKKFLGDIRFQQYLTAHDHEFEQLCKFTEENGLRPQTALAVFEVQSAAKLAMLKVRENRDLQGKEQRLQLGSIAQSTRDAVHQLLGEKVMERYATNGGGWLMELETP